MENTTEIKDLQRDDIVAFKSKREGKEGWFTGIVNGLAASTIKIDIIHAVHPQWGEGGDFNVAWTEDIVEIVLLERVENKL